jgi:hypothetical protein
MAARAQEAAQRIQEAGVKIASTLSNSGKPTAATRQTIIAEALDSLGNRDLSVTGKSKTDIASLLTAIDPKTGMPDTSGIDALINDVSAKYQGILQQYALKGSGSYDPQELKDTYDTLEFLKTQKAAIQQELTKAANERKAKQMVAQAKEDAAVQRFLSRKYGIQGVPGNAGILSPEIQNSTAQFLKRWKSNQNDGYPGEKPDYSFGGAVRTSLKESRQQHEMARLTEKLQKLAENSNGKNLGKAFVQELKASGAFKPGGALYAAGDKAKQNEFTKNILGGVDIYAAKQARKPVNMGAYISRGIDEANVSRASDKLVMQLSKVIDNNPNGTNAALENFWRTSPLFKKGGPLDGSKKEEAQVIYQAIIDAYAQVRQDEVTKDSAIGGALQAMREEHARKDLSKDIAKTLRTSEKGDRRAALSRLFDTEQMFKKGGAFGKLTKREQYLLYRDAIVEASQINESRKSQKKQNKSNRDGWGESWQMGGNGSNIYVGEMVIRANTPTEFGRLTRQQARKVSLGGRG